MITWQRIREYFGKTCKFIGRWLKIGAGVLGLYGLGSWILGSTGFGLAVVSLFVGGLSIQNLGLEVLSVGKNT